jgi:Flp pilus assembly pilin Flp
MARLHRDERGYTMLDYVMVFAFVAVPLMFLFDKLFEVLSDYFGMVAYYVTWPFL